MSEDSLSAKPIPLFEPYQNTKLEKRIQANATGIDGKGNLQNFNGTNIYWYEPRTLFSF